MLWNISVEDGMAKKKLVGFLIFLILVLVLLWKVPVKDIFQGELLRYLQSLVEENFFLAALVYVLLCALAGAFLALPGISYALLAGMVFHAFWGTVLCTLAASISAGISFLMGRYFLQDSIKPKLMQNPYIARYFMGEEKKNLLVLLFITRTIPVFPFNLQNYAYGITDISFSLYFVCSFLFMIPGTAMYTIAFAGLQEKKNPWIYFLTAGVLFCLLMGMLYFFKKREKAMGKEEKA